MLLAYAARNLVRIDAGWARAAGRARASAYTHDIDGEIRI
jgi:hypothetical protein